MKKIFALAILLLGAQSFVETTVAELKAQLGDDKVILGLSGGEDHVHFFYSGFGRKDRPNG